MVIKMSEAERIIQLKKDRDKFKGMIREILIEYGAQPTNAMDAFESKKTFKQCMEDIKDHVRRETIKDVHLIVTKMKK